MISVSVHLGLYPFIPWHAAQRLSRSALNVVSMWIVHGDVIYGVIVIKDVVFSVTTVTLMMIDYFALSSSWIVIVHTLYILFCMLTG